MSGWGWFWYALTLILFGGLTALGVATVRFFSGRWRDRGLFVLLLAPVLQTVGFAVAIIFGWQLLILILGVFGIGIGMAIFMLVFWPLVFLALVYFVYRQFLLSAWWDRHYPDDGSRRTHIAGWTVLVAGGLSAAFLLAWLGLSCSTMANDWSPVHARHAAASQGPTQPGQSSQAPFRGDTVATWSWHQFGKDMVAATPSVRKAEMACATRITGITPREAARYVLRNNRGQLDDRVALTVGAASGYAARVRLDLEGVHRAYTLYGQHYRTITVYGPGCIPRVVRGPLVTVTLVPLRHPRAPVTYPLPHKYPWRPGTGILPNGDPWVAGSK